MNPTRVVSKGKWGYAVYGRVTLPDKRELEICIFIGNAKKHNPKKFKIKTVFPVRGDGVSAVLEDGRIVKKSFEEEGSH